MIPERIIFVSRGITVYVWSNIKWSAVLNPDSDTLEPDRPQCDRFAAYIIAQQYFSVAICSLPFHSRTDKCGASFDLILFFRSAYLTLRKVKEWNSGSEYTWRSKRSSQYIPIHLSVLSYRVQLNCDGTQWRTGGQVKGKLANGVGSQYSSHYLGTWYIQHYYRWCAHLGCQ